MPKCKFFVSIFIELGFVVLPESEDLCLSSTLEDFCHYIFPPCSLRIPILVLLYSVSLNFKKKHSFSICLIPHSSYFSSFLSSASKVLFSAISNLLFN